VSAGRFAFPSNQLPQTTQRYSVTTTGRVTVRWRIAARIFIRVLTYNTLTQARCAYVSEERCGPPQAMVSSLHTHPDETTVRSGFRPATGVEDAEALEPGFDLSPRVLGTGLGAPVTIREAVVRYRGARRRVASTIRSPGDAARFFRRLIDDDAREHFVALLLDARHRPIGYQVVSVGTATASLVHPREVFQAAVSLGACAVIVGHNHPSSDPTPSPEDREVTRRLARAGEVLGIRLLDSLVITATGHVSIREESPDVLDVS
jgi:DNA repair protein RadC